MSRRQVTEENAARKGGELRFDSPVQLGAVELDAGAAETM